MKYLKDNEINELVEAIKKAENQSTGEIRLHIDSRTNGNNAEIAFAEFQSQCMNKTAEKNAVLFHVNFKEKYFTIIGDEGIHKKVCQSFWDKIHDEATIKFSKGLYFEGLRDSIISTGIELKKYFPISGGGNPNELSDEISFS